jgi:hypothetical protein
VIDPPLRTPVTQPFAIGDDSSPLAIRIRSSRDAGPFAHGAHFHGAYNGGGVETLTGASRVGPWRAAASEARK